MLQTTRPTIGNPHSHILDQNNDIKSDIAKGRQNFLQFMILSTIYHLPSIVTKRVSKADNCITTRWIDHLVVKMWSETTWNGHSRRFPCSRWGYLYTKKNILIHGVTQACSSQSPKQWRNHIELCHQILLTKNKNYPNQKVQLPCEKPWKEGA